MAEVKRYHTALSLGAKRHMTPEGFLICLDVPMARTGVMKYGPRETLIPSRDGYSPVDIHREPEDVFSEQTIMSIIGKPVTNDHPPVNVQPENWRDYAVGSVLTSKRGDGEFADLLLGDIIITDAKAIQEILDGKKEVSCGYDADYEELEPGVGKQTNIQYNHLALVDKGRCGPRCAIGDSEYAIGDYEPEEKPKMSKKKSLLDRVKQFVKDGTEIQEELENSEAAAEDAEPGKGNGDVHIHIGTSGVKTGDLPTAAKESDATDEENNMNNGGENGGALPPAIEARFQGIENAVKQIAEMVKGLQGGGGGGNVGDEDPDAESEAMAEEAAENVDMKTVRDSAVFHDSYRETVALAEIIVPGIRGAPTFDAKASFRSTFDVICNFRRMVLDVAYNQPATRSTIDELMGKGRKYDGKCMTCDTIRGLFRSLGFARRNQNNANVTGGGAMQLRAATGDDAARGSIRNPADLNRFVRARREAATK